MRKVHYNTATTISKKTNKKYIKVFKETLYQRKTIMLAAENQSRRTERCDRMRFRSLHLFLPNNSGSNCVNLSLSCVFNGGHEAEV